MLLEHKKDCRLSYNSSVPCTEKATPRKEANTEMETVAVRRGLGNTVITTLALRRKPGFLQNVKVSRWGPTHFLWACVRI